MSALVIVLGDQLDRGGAAFDGFDRRRDRVWMAEVAEESTHVWSHKARITVFLAAMRSCEALAAARLAGDFGSKNKTTSSSKSFSRPAVA